METLTLDVKTREQGVSAKDLRNAGLIPAEYYGRGVENKSFQMDYQTFRKVFREAGSNTIITLNIDGKDEINVLAHDVRFNPVTDAFEHVDFINVRMGEEITTVLSLEFVGMAPAVKELSGTLMPSLNEVDIKCLPKDLISSIEVSIESLIDFNNYVRVKDLNIPEGITVLNNPEDVVVTVVAPREEKEEEVVAPTEEGEAAEGEEAAEGAEVAEGGDAKASEGKEEKSDS